MVPSERERTPTVVCRLWNINGAELVVCWVHGDVLTLWGLPDGRFVSVVGMYPPVVCCEQRPWKPAFDESIAGLIRFRCRCSFRSAAMLLHRNARWSMEVGLPWTEAKHTLRGGCISHHGRVSIVL